MAQKDKRVKDKALLGKDRVGFILDLFYALVFCLSIAIFVKIVYIQLTYRVDPSVVSFFRPLNTRRAEQPQRGAILSHDGRILAISTPRYQVYMDCTVQKDRFRQDKEHGAELERDWQKEARGLAEGLARIYQDRTANEYYNLILTGRKENRQYVRIGSRIPHATLQEVKALPLFCKGQNVGGIIIRSYDAREYPYGGLARRTIGYVKDNSRNEDGSSLTRIGIEGKFDYVLHGKDGFEWLRKAEKGGKVHNFDSTAVKAVDGDDIRTTLDIDIQDIADRALRRQITEEDRLSGACAVVMDVHSGAIRAMVNLSRDTTLAGSPLLEQYNLAISQAGEPGSVFKTVTLTSLLEDGYVHSVDETIPTNRGAIPYAKKVDKHIRDWEDSTGRKTITIKRGLEISSNYVFAHLATKYYATHPKDFYDKLYRYKLAEKFDFDIEGLATPSLVSPDSPSWHLSSLETAAYGYSVTVTPLHLLTFYNGIANKGNMVRPYLVEDIERDGRKLKTYGTASLGNICSPATADTVTRALRGVTTLGTARGKLRAAKLPVAGKTGTAQVALMPHERSRKGGDAYHDASGRKKNQGTFVGFFPADDPKYSVIVTVYSKLSHGSFYGGDAPAKAVREIVDNIYAIDPQWNPAIGRTQAMPQPALAGVPAVDGKAPDLRGMGLSDALYTLESNGYRCRYEGSGHVKDQTPAAGAKIAKGETITLILK